MRRVILMRTAFIVVLFLFSGRTAFGQSEPWLDIYDYAGEPDRGNALCIDGNGNTYVTGYLSSYDSEIDGNMYNLPVITYDPAGQRTILNIIESEDQGYRKYGYLGGDIALGNDGIYIAGSRECWIEFPEYGWWYVQGYIGYALKIDWNGSVVWDDIIGDSPTWSSSPFPLSEVALDNEGNVYFIGMMIDDDELGVILKYSPNGNVIWEKVFPEKAYYDFRHIRVFDDDKIVVAASSYEFDECHLVKITGDGDTVWEREVYSWNLDYITDIEIDNQGNVYLAGYFGPYQEKQYYTAKYNADGDLLWEKTYGGLGIGYGYAGALAVDETGNVYVTGSFKFDGENNYDFCTIKYDTNGNQEWISTYEGSYYGFGSPKNIAVDNEGNIVITGRAGYNICTVKIDENGGILWDQVESRGYEPNDMVLDSNDDIYITGTTGSYGDLITFKILSDGTAASIPGGDGGNIPTVFSLYQNFPNPVTESTTIKFVLPESGFTELEVFDIKGRKVDTIIAEDMKEGENEVEYNCSLSSGVYLYKLTSGDYSAVKKMVVK